MIKREAIAQVEWGKYIRLSNLKGAFELKQTTNDLLNYDVVEEHQINGLLAIMENGLVWKLSDADPREKPCDSFATPPMNGYIVIWWNLHKKFTVIRIGDFLAEKINSTEKSLSYTKACDIAERIVKV